MSQKNNQKNNQLNLLKARFLRDFVLVRPIVDKGSKGIINPAQYEDKTPWGEVVSVGPGRILDNGETIPMSAKPGDIVHFERFSSKKERIDGVDYLIIREEDIDSIISK